MGFFKKAFGWTRHIPQVAKGAKAAMPFVRLAASIAPVPGLNAAIALCDKWVLPPLEWYSAIPEEHQEIVLRDIVRRAMQKQFPEMKNADLNLAIEAAVTAMKGGK